MSRNVNLPYSTEAERAVIGSSLLSSDALEASLEILNPDDFYNNSLRIIFSVIRDMYSEGNPVDYITVAEELQRRETLNRVGGQNFIDKLVADVRFTGNVAHYAGIVRERSTRRKIIAAGERIARLACSCDKEVPDILGDAENVIFDAGQNINSRKFLASREIISPVLANIVARLREHGSPVTGYSTGFADMDKFTGGLQPGSLNVIAARPSMGKTALAMNIAQFGGGQANAPVLIFSLEMPAEQIVQRMIAAEAGVDLSRLVTGLFDTSEFENVRRACDTVARRNIFINDSTSLSAVDFRGRCRRFKNRHPDLALVVVDYLQLMSSGEQAARTANRQQEVSDISRMLKASAREVNCPVIALSQLSRQAENRSDKKPQLADLRDSGAIEQDADTVMMMFRPDYYSDNENNELTDSEAEIRVAKNRNGSTGVFRLTFRREITRFYNHGEI